MFKTFVFVTEIMELDLNVEGNLEESINRTIEDFSKQNNLREVKRSTNVALSPRGEYQNSTVATIVVTSEFEKISLEEVIKTLESIPLEDEFK